MAVDDRPPVNNNNTITILVVIAAIVIIGSLIFMDFGMKRPIDEKNVNAPEEQIKTNSIPKVDTEQPLRRRS